MMESYGEYNVIFHDVIVIFVQNCICSYCYCDLRPFNVIFWSLTNCMTLCLLLMNDYRYTISEIVCNKRSRFYRIHSTLTSFYDMKMKLGVVVSHTFMEGHECVWLIAWVQSHSDHWFLSYDRCVFMEFDVYDLDFSLILTEIIEFCVQRSG